MSDDEPRDAMSHDAVEPTPSVAALNVSMPT
jgi:hypothetical protein